MTKDQVRSTEEAFSTERALKQALEALELSAVTVDSFGVQSKAQNAITAIQQALNDATHLAAPVQQSRSDVEPVAWMWTHKTAGNIGVYFEHPSKFFDLTKPSDYEWTPLYTTPPAQRQWVGLTQQDIDIAFDDTQEGGGFDEFASAIEQRLKEKNSD